jgi:hypothetical protein
MRFEDDIRHTSWKAGGLKDMLYSIIPHAGRMEMLMCFTPYLVEGWRHYLLCCVSRLLVKLTMFHDGTQSPSGD